MSPMSDDVDELKREAALRAAEYVKDGMVVGLGTGSTAKYAVQALGEKVARGMRIVGVPTSDRTAELARSVGIELATLEEQPSIDVTIDGADEVDLATLYGIKGLGGALLHEKMVAQATKTQIIIVDESKVVQRLGTHAPLPVEVISFGWSRTQEALRALGCEPVLRRGADGQPYITDSGNYLLDCRFSSIDDPHTMGDKIKLITGVVDHGLFIDLISRVIIAGYEGIREVTLSGKQ